MIKLIQVGFLALVLALAAGTAFADGPVLTVSGQISKTNRGAVDSFSDVLFSKLDVQFDSAYEFSLDDLHALPQKTLKTAYPDWPGEVEVSGPTLGDVLSHVGATGKVVSVRAVDGYAPEFTLADINADTFILATRANGKTLGMGGRGPIWLVFAPGSYEDQSETDSGLTWAAIHLEVN